jgi:hypothetical protein
MRVHGGCEDGLDMRLQGVEKHGSTYLSSAEVISSLSNNDMMLF